MNKYCAICRRRLAEETTELVCARERCQLINQARISISSRIDQFKEFWVDKVTSEANYKEYFLLIGKEETYQNYVIDLQNRGIQVPSRRTYFHLNHASVHVNWPDEFGRLFVNPFQQE